MQAAPPHLSAQPVATPARARAWKGLTVVTLGASLLGLSAIFVKWAVTGGATPLTVGAHRMLIALPGAYLLARRDGGLGAGAGRRWALLAGLFFFGDVWAWHWAMGKSSAANATFIAGGLCPIWVALFSVLVLGLRYGWLGWLGQGLGVTGALILALAKGARVGTGAGEAVAVLASLSYAGFTLSLARSRRTVKATQAMFWLTLSAFVFFGLGSLVAQHALWGFDGRAWLSLVGLGLLVHLLAWLMNSWGLGHVDAAYGALGLQAQQVATLFLAAWLLAEPLRPLGLLGGALIVGGIIAVAFSPRRA